jgi:hypothetical protein
MLNLVLQSQLSCSTLTSILDLDLGPHDLTFPTSYTVLNLRPIHTTYANTATFILNLGLDARLLYSSWNLIFFIKKSFYIRAYDLFYHWKIWGSRNRLRTTIYKHKVWGFCAIPGWGWEWGIGWVQVFIGRANSFKVEYETWGCGCRLSTRFQSMNKQL